MPTATLSADRLNAVLPRPTSAEELEERLFSSKAELKDWSGDTLSVEVTPDRLDLLDESGLALHLEGQRGDATGPPPLRRTRAPRGLEIRVDEGVGPLRPVIAGLLVSAPDGKAIEAALLDEAVRYQELLHATVGQGRRLASLGMYSMERLRPPLSYRREPMASVRFTPLDADAEVDAASFYATHPLAAKYGEYGRTEESCLTFRDSAGRVLSLPPVLNGRPAGEVRPGDRTLLLESTGTVAARVHDALGLLALPFVVAGFSFAPVPVVYPDRRESGRSLLTPRTVRLPDRLVGEILGTPVSRPETARLLGTARLKARSKGRQFLVAAPPWRPDLAGGVDLAEEVILSRGLRVEESRVPPSPTRGRRQPESRFRERVERLLLGLGFTGLHTTVLVPTSLTQLLDRAGALRLTYPVSEELAYVRDSLETSLLSALLHNVRHAYPQRLAEVGPVILRDTSAETGAATRYHAGAVLAAEEAGFADAAALADCLVRAFGARGVREPAELPGTIPGRSARLRIAGEVVAEMGELHPAVLTELHVPVPVAWTEVDLTALFPLVRRGETV